MSSSSWSLPSLSSLASQLTDLSTKVTSTVTSTASSVSSTAGHLLSPLTDSVQHIIADTQRSFDEEQNKVDQRRAHLTALQEKPPPSPLWAVASESQQILEAELKQRLLRLSADPRTFLSPAPDDASFPFSLDVAYPYCEVALREDAGLGRARYRLVPRRVSEHQFWKNYMWRVHSVREQMGVGLLFDTSMLEAEQDREKLEVERMKKREEDIARDKKQQLQPLASQQKSAVALPVAMPSPPSSAAGREEKEGGRKTNLSPAPLPSATASSSTSSSSARGHAGGGRSGGGESVNSGEGEVISDDYVNVGAMRKELAVQGKGLEASSAAAAGIAEDDGDGGEGLEGVTDADLDDLESMLADIQVNEGEQEASNELLEELETLPTTQQLSAKR